MTAAIGSATYGLRTALIDELGAPYVDAGPVSETAGWDGPMPGSVLVGHDPVALAGGAWGARSRWCW
jgi:hypothetical protein